MKKSIKYWMAASSLFLIAPLFSACDDDDTVIVEQPTEFKATPSSLNVQWDETEGVLDLESVDDWTVDSDSPWLKPELTKGEVGFHRIFLQFDSNPYMLPRKGDLTVTSGAQTKTISIVQGGRPGDLVEPCTMNLEVESLDYATGEVDLAPYAEQILGNLGMTLAEFGSGVDDDGNLDFFMVDNSGQWIEGGTAGTRCGAWLDRDLKVTHWDGAGFPANACFIEVYGGEKPVIVVGRAPGVPDDAEYTLRFGFTPKDDHSKYVLMNLTVVFPKMDLKGEIVDTVDLDVTIAPNSDYVPTPVAFDAAAVASVLGTSNIANVKVVSYGEDGEFIPYTGNNGYWFDQNGNVASWGEGCGWFIEYHGDDPEADETALTSWNIGPFPGVNAASGVSKIGLWYNAKVVMFNIKVTVKE